MSSSPAISIVVPLYNEEDNVTELQQQIDRALAGRDYELVLVDDGSKDGTVRVACEFVTQDPRVKVLRFDDGKSLAPMAILMHAVCHPCFFTWGDKGSQPHPKGFPMMTADFPGEAQTFVEMVYGQKTSAMFMQGCAGDIRPNLPGYPYRCADEADIQWAGRDLGGAVTRAAAFSATLKVAVDPDSAVTRPAT